MAAPNALQIQALKARLLILDLSNPDAEVIIGELANALGHTVIDISQTGTGDFEIELNTRTHPTFKDFINSIRATGLPEAQYDDLNDVVAANTAAFAPRSRVKSDAELLTEEIGKTFTGGAVDPKVDAFLKRVTKGKGYVLSKDPISNEMSIAVNGGAAQDLCDYLDANARPADIHKALGALKPAKAPADPKKDSVLGGVLDNDILKKLTGDMVYACQHVTNDAADEIDSRANKRAWGFGLATFVATLPTFPLNVLIGAAIGKLVYEGSSRLDHYISPEKLAPKVAAVNGLRDYLVTALQKAIAKELSI